MKLYSIRNWNSLYENNRSRTVKDLSWVAIPNSHDGENFTNIMAHKDGAIIFTAFILMVEIASKCLPRGTLQKDNGTPHTVGSLSAKCRAPASWFEIAISYLEKETDWLDVKEFLTESLLPDSALPPSCQSGAQEGREGMERKKGGNSASSREVFDFWNQHTSLTKCLVLSDKRRHSLLSRLKDPFFVENWKAAMDKIPESAFCMGRNERGWRANFDWFLQPDTVAKIIEGKYDSQRAPRPVGHILDAK